MPERSNGSDSSKTTVVSMVNGGPAPKGSAQDTESATSRSKQASSAWREFSVASKRMLKYADVYSDIDRALNQQYVRETELKKQRDTMEIELKTQTDAMEAQIRELKDKILQLELSRKEQLKVFESEYDEWKARKSSLELQEKTLNNEMAATHTREMQDLQGKLKLEQENSRRLSASLKRANTEVDLANKERSLYMDQLKEWERYISLLKDTDFEALKMQMIEFFQDCFAFARAHFCINLPSETLRDYAQWDRHVADLAVSLSLPPTNSPAAQRTRVAVALHVLATRLHANIFKPCYMPEPSSDCQIFKDILTYQLKSGMGQEEKLMRALFLSTYSEDQVKEAINRAVHITLEEIQADLGIFLHRDDHTFHTDLVTLLHRATDMWVEMQHSKKAVEVNVDDKDSPDWQWDHLKEFGELAGSQKPKIFNLFPRIYVPDDDTVVHPGVVLWEDQETVFAADRELGEIIARRRSRAGSSVNEIKVHRTRRQSTVIGTTSSSPRTEMLSTVPGIQQSQGKAV